VVKSDDSSHVRSLVIPRPTAVRRRHVAKTPISFRAGPIGLEHFYKLALG
jgi:hypothetical protein